MLSLTEDQVYHPAPADMRPRLTAVVERVRVVAPGVLQGVGQDWHRGEVAGLLYRTSEDSAGLTASHPACG
jgi:hypothetical protein